MPTFLMQVEPLVVLFITIKIYAPFKQLVYAFSRIFHNLFYSVNITVTITGNQRIINVFIEIIRRIHHCGDTALCIRRITFFECGFAK